MLAEINALCAHTQKACSCTHLHLIPFVNTPCMKQCNLFLPQTSLGVSNTLDYLCKFGWINHHSAPKWHSTYVCTKLSTYVNVVALTSWAKGHSNSVSHLVDTNLQPAA